MTKDNEDKIEFNINDHVVEINKEDIEAYFRPFIDMAKSDEKSSNQYLNKLDVIKLIRKLADASEPMVSAPTYDYYRINAGDTLEALHELKTYSNPERG